MLDNPVQVINLLASHVNILEEITLKKDVYRDFVKEFSLSYEYSEKDWVVFSGIIIRRGI